MKRSFPSPARDALCVVLGALACGAACEPNNNVKPGAPELIELTLVTPGPTAMTVTADTPDCAAIKTGDACMPAPAPPAVPDTLCRLASASNWCMCTVTDPMGDPNVGTWGCDPFSNVMAVVAVFDRLLDTTPLDPGDAPGRMDIVMTSAGAGAAAFDVLTDYSATGDKNGLIFNLFGPAFFGNFRADGPSLFTAPQPAFPSGTAVTVTLNGDKVRAKDGHTQFTGANLLMSGSIAFTTAPFSASVSPPDATAMDPNAATVSFTNVVEAAACPSMDPMDMTKTIPCATASHISATAGGTAVAVDVSSGGGSSVTVTPTAGKWPMGAMVVITVDATTKDLLNETIDMAATGMFTAP